ncbi:putative glycosyl hydrolase-like family 15 (GHL15) protein [Mariniflexile fucanivorans]|uniref:Putative glycosyl hydrolase-like family 15 (GHL15) protein n=1 Tax=Mariniflexile fucanivorans TaxID=264023 RepID=A0A4R1RNP3_9FLAO|nr:putative glycoside hydrolase [Mariniflexile fucanivorans]TCL67472.1 putative glycosyl hydrolase-like family 15 (GHL15) protein [Mariniflexile fucanivorans]
MNKSVRMLNYLFLVTLFCSSLMAQNSCVLSDGNTFQSKEFYPKFSWEVTPQYFMFGDGTRLLSSKEVATIAEKTTFICIEKNHAQKTLKYAEIGAKQEIAAFKAVNPEIKALFYFNSAYAWPFTSYNENFTKKNIYQHPELKKFLIKKPNSEELEHRNNIFQFDVLNPEFREWWVNTVAKGVEFSGADGVFIDQMHGFVWLRNEKKVEVEKAMGEMMTNLKAKIGPDKILIGNNASSVTDVFPAIDAAMFEHYNAKKLSKESLLKEWAEMLNNAKAGKMSIFRIGVEAEWDNAQGVEATVGGKHKPSEKELELLSKERLEYYQACFLIGAQPYSYFQYGWGWKLSTGPLVDYPELLKPLGAPKEAYKRTTPKGWEFTREFEHASVWLDTEKKEAKITWKN